MTVEIQEKGKRDPDFLGADKALKRAAQKAREIARNTGTAVVYIEAGEIKKEKFTNTQALSCT